MVTGYGTDMPRGRPPADTVQISFRVPTSWVTRAERVAAGGRREASADLVSTSSVYRKALGLGLGALEARHLDLTKLTDDELLVLREGGQLSAATLRRAKRR